ncbi:hypothetical protein ACEUZ9_002685 [Paracoccus litorisediminis]|uniref:hypothetical protein n=1 Tax=Paracoccus litorisediminis TaxID=2006130 RepID=UPI003732C8F8
MNRPITTLAHALAEAFGGDPKLARQVFKTVYADGPSRARQRAAVIAIGNMGRDDQAAFWGTIAGVLRPVVLAIEEAGTTRFDPEMLRLSFSEEVKYARASIAGWPPALHVVPTEGQPDD